MLSQLPDSIQKEVLFHIQNNNFPKAKEIHDEWLSSHRLQINVKKKYKERSAEYVDALPA